MVAPKLFSAEIFPIPQLNILLHFDESFAKGKKFPYLL
jgi:hypothetical protein